MAGGDGDRRHRRLRARDRAPTRLPPSTRSASRAVARRTWRRSASSNTHLAKHVQPGRAGVSRRRWRALLRVPARVHRCDGRDRAAATTTSCSSTRTCRSSPASPSSSPPGARVADVACGTGHALVLLARAFPASTFVGYDLDEEAIERARPRPASRAHQRRVRGGRRRPGCGSTSPFDVVFMFDALHDQVDPAGVLAAIHAALVPGGTLRHEGAARCRATSRTTSATRCAPICTRSARCTA